MKKIVTKSGQEFIIWSSRKEASKELSVILEGMKCAFVEGAEMDDSIYIKYKDGRTYSFNKFEETGKFRKTNFDVVIFSNDCVSVAYGQVVLRNIDDYEEIYSPEKDSEEKIWFFNEKEPETTEAETATETEPETATDPETADQGETAESDTKQYECENVVQVAHKVADLTKTRLDRQVWKEYCDEVKKDGSSWFDYTAFDPGGNEFDVSIFLGYDQQNRHYFVSVDYEKCPVPDMSGGA